MEILGHALFIGAIVLLVLAVILVVVDFLWSEERENETAEKTASSEVDIEAAISEISQTQRDETEMKQDGAIHTRDRYD